MARSPLFRTIRRSLEIARLAATAGRPPSELVEEARARRSAGRNFTRREFLRTSGAAAAALGIAGCGAGRLSGSSASGNRDAQVVIVGAGIAGLTAGWRLHQAGIPVRILEAQDRVGGRMFSIRDHFADGQSAELGGELIDTGHTHIRGLAAELELELDDLLEAETFDEVWFFDGRRVSSDDLADAYLPVATRIESDLDTLHSLDEWPWASYRDPNGAEALDHTPLAQWLASTEMDPFFRRLLDVGFTAEYGLETHDQSALNLLFLMDPEPDHFHLYGEGDERFRVRGGNDRIPRELARRLEPWIDTGSRLEALRERDDGAFELSVRSDQSSRTMTAPFVILALPFTLLREVAMEMTLPPAKRLAIDELGYGTNAKLMMGFGERVWRTRHDANGSVLTDLPFQVSWETSREQPGAHGILTNFTGGAHGASLGEGSAAEQARRAVAHMEGIFPGIQDAHLAHQAVRFHWPTHPWTRGSYACYRPGQWTRICGAEGERVRRLHFAGEHCSLEAQGFMEGGCETGERAAREVLEAMGRLEPASAA